MPELVPDATPPKPPPVAQMPRSGPWDPVVQAQRLQSHFEHSLVVWLQQQITALRATVNWLIDQQGVRNLIPDSDIKDPATYWTIGGGIAAIDGIGWGGGRGLLVSPGPTTAEAVSDPFVVVPGGDQYVLSGWIDASRMTAGTASWLIRDAVSMVEFAEVFQTLGVAGRVQILAEIPAITLTAEVVFRVVGAEGEVVASQPQVELPRLGGHIGVTRPQATLYRNNDGA